jgi:hypothetical protein
MPWWAVGIVIGGVLAAWSASRRTREISSGGGGGGIMSGSLGNVPNLSDAFWQTLWNVANDLDADPKVLGLLLFEESGINPAAKNSIGCVGINQFCDGTFGGFVDISKDAYLALSAEAQLDPYVKKYWAAGPSGSLATPRDNFWRSLLPATWKADADPSAVVNDPAVLGASYAAKVSAANPLGQTGDVITAGDIDRYLARVASSAGWQLALQKIDAFDPNGGAVASNAGGGHPDPDPSASPGDTADTADLANPDSTPAAGLPAADDSGDASS